VSIKQLFIVGTLVLVTLLGGGAVFSLYVFAAAEGELLRALRSYEQLAIATGLETEAARALLIEVQEREGLDPALIPARDRAAVAASIDLLIEEIREEIGSIADPDEQAVEAQEFVAAFAIRADYERLMALLDARPRGTALGAEVLENFGRLEGRLAGVVAGEREEVAAAIADVAAFRLRLRTYAMTAAVLLALTMLVAALGGYRFLMRPLRRLGSGSAELAAGNIGHRIRPAGPPELRLLATRLNEMAQRLEEQRTTLRRSNEQLEETVAARTEELAEKARRLQDIDESRRLFFAKVGHELRTPLTVLLGEVDVALGAPTATVAEHREALEHVGIHGEQLKRRIADLMALARSEDGRLRIHPQTLDLPDLAREVVAATRAYAVANDVTLSLRPAPSLTPVEADADRIRQALSALIDNAIKFSPPGGEVVLRLAAQDDGVRLEVLDAGPGVRDDEVMAITRAYLHGADAGSRAGSGLGLTIASWIAEQHGGRLEVGNQPGGGLTAALILPHAPGVSVGAT